MSTWAVIGLIAIVLGVIVSNIMLLKYSAKFKMPKAYTPPKSEGESSSDAVTDAAGHEEKAKPGDQ